MREKENKKLFLPSSRIPLESSTVKIKNFFHFTGEIDVARDSVLLETQISRVERGLHAQTQLCPLPFYKLRYKNETNE